MTRLLILPIVAALALASGSAIAQTKMPDSLTNCHTPGAGNAAKDTTGTAGAKDGTGNAQDVDKSVILPSAGGHENSASPTVQRDGKSVEARADCPDDPNTPKPKG